jgi:hypothetical protein
MNEGSIPLSKLQPLVTKRYSEERIIRMDVESFSKSDAHGFEDGCLAYNLFE